MFFSVSLWKSVGFNKIILQTPHTTLKLLLEKNIPGVSNQRFAHWLLSLSSKQIEIDHNAKYILPQLMQYEGHAHECVNTFQETYSPLFRKESDPADEQVFVDGSRFFSGGKYHTGYAIWYPKRNHAVQHKLPGHYSAQRAEIEAVKTVLKFDDKENKGPLVIYSDSAYVVRSLTDYLSVWKKRGFVDSSNKVLVHSDTLKEIFELASNKPNCYAIIKLQAHKKGDDELTIGNSTADLLAKEAAIAGEEVIDTKLEQVFPLRKTVTANMPSFIEEQIRDPSLVFSRGDPKPPFVCENGVLCHDLNGNLRPVVPKHLQIEFTRYNHVSLGHLGKQRLLEVLKEKFYWEKMEETVQNVVQSCLICAQINPRPKGQKPPLLRIAPADGLWSTLQIDYIGPLPTGKHGLRYALVVVDVFSKWVEVLPVRKDDSVSTARALVNHVFCTWGLPRLLSSDRGSHFTGKIMQTVCALLGVQQQFHAPYHPQSAGIVERMNRTIKSRIAKILLDKGNTWVDAIPFVLMSIRGTISSATQFTPFELMTGRKMPLIFPNEPFLSTPQKDVIARSNWLQLLQENLKTILPHAASRMQRMTPPHADKFVKGASVMVKIFRKSGPWESNWEGPFEIINKMGQVMILVQRSPNATKNTRRIQKFWVHVDQCKLFVAK